MNHQVRMKQIQTLIKRTFNGAVPAINKELKYDFDKYFEIGSGHVLGDIIEFIRDYKIRYEKYRKHLRGSGFSTTLYLVFQEFRQSLDAFLAESVNPDVISYARDKENRIREYFETITSPYNAMVQEAIVDYENTMKGYGINLNHGKLAVIDLPDMDFIKRVGGLTFPAVSISMRYSAVIRTEAVMRLGIYSMINFFRKLLKKEPNAAENTEQEIRALRDGIARIKRETEKSIIFYFKDLRENLKFNYFFKLIDTTSNVFSEFLVDRFNTHTQDLSKMVELLSKNQINKEEVSDILKKMERQFIKINSRINIIRHKIEPENSNSSDYAKNFNQTSISNR